MVERKQNQIVNILLLGVPGSGKSTFGNHLLNSDVFETGEITETGLTQTIQGQQGHLFGDQSKQMIKVFDIPGIGDSNIGPEQLVEEFQKKIGEGQSIDIALLIVKQNEYRMTVQQKCSIAVLQHFLTKIQPKSIVWVFTHCDQKNPTNEFIDKKIKSYELKVDLPQNNIIFFSKLKPETIQPIENLLVKTGMKVAEDLYQASKNILQEMDKWTDVPKTEINELIKMMMQNSQDLNASMMQNFQEMNQKAIQQQDKQTQMMLNQMENQIEKQQELFREAQREQQENNKINQENQQKQHQEQLKLLQQQMEQQRQLNIQLAKQASQPPPKRGGCFSQNSKFYLSKAKITFNYNNNKEFELTKVNANQLKEGDTILVIKFDDINPENSTQTLEKIVIIDRTYENIPMKLLKIYLKSQKGSFNAVHTLSYNHYVQVFRKQDGQQFLKHNIPAYLLEKDDVFLVLNNNKTFEFASIDKIEATDEEGALTIFSENAEPIVDDVYASSFSENGASIKEFKAAKILYQIHQKLPKIVQHLVIFMRNTNFFYKKKDDVEDSKLLNFKKKFSVFI